MDTLGTTGRKPGESEKKPHLHGGNIYQYKEVLDFSANINFRGMPEPVLTAAKEAVDFSVHYPEPECERLRAALAERENRLRKKNGLLEKSGLPVESGLPGENELSGNCGLPGENGLTENIREIASDHIICGNGAAELMFALAAAYAPQHALLAIPSFFEYEQALAAFGCRISRFPLRKEKKFALEESLLGAIAEDTDIIILGNPNNPTGQLIAAELLAKLLRICAERNILLVLDESFFDFLDEKDRERTFSGVCAVVEHPQLFVLKSFTKMYAMPGLRFGYGICSNAELLSRMRSVIQPWNVSLPAQRAAEAAAAELRFACETARQTAVNRDAVKRRLEETGYTVYPSAANFLLLEGAGWLKEACLAEGFLIRDCSNFPGLSEGFFRICIRSEAENEALLRVLAHAAARGGTEK